MSNARVFLLSLSAMLAFAANSLLCRVALKHTSIDAASFTAIRIVSGALVLGSIVRWQGGKSAPAGSWISALALFSYAAAFSFAYVSLTAASGALLLFGAVQATMIGVGLFQGERLRGVQWLGLASAAAGLVGLLLPGLSAPPWQGSVLMLVAGAAWGLYSLRGKGSGDPLRVTAGNFLRAGAFAVVLGVAMWSRASLDGPGIACAIASGGIASGLGYAVWYAALPGLKVASAATVQLSVPMFAAVGGILLLGEPFTLRLALASITILGGIALVVVPRRSA